MSQSARERPSVMLERAPASYRVISRIAAGGMAEVWRAEALYEGDKKIPVAIKRVLPELAGDARHQEMFRHESRLGKLLRHPNIVRVYDARKIAGTFIMVMELVDGCALKSLLDRALTRNAPMPVPPALHIAIELLRGLDYAHSAVDAAGQALSIVHCDVSPHNVLLSKNGHVKLADFGLALTALDGARSASEMVGGKLAYLAPEIIDQQAPDGRVDLFGVGVILWEMLCGQRLFQGSDEGDTVRRVHKCEVEPPSRYNKRASPELDAVVLRSLRRDRDTRFATAGAFADALEALAREGPYRADESDVALVVGVHNAMTAQPEPPPPPNVASLIEQELAGFAESTDDDAFSTEGAVPLDPTAFRAPPAPRVPSGERPLAPPAAWDNDDWRLR
ncbi:MAG: serine/threonine protein kinase [Deltaproteobacteria bacterium]|nr:serine/threonine protein kinase [Deltaproteobacteria bacterium]